MRGSLHSHRHTLRPAAKRLFCLNCAILAAFLNLLFLQRK